MTQIKTYGLNDLRAAIVDLLRQGLKSSNSSDNCVYNLEVDGKIIHCVIGHMIKNDPFAQSIIENEGLNLDANVMSLIRGGVFDVEPSLDPIERDKLIGAFWKAQNIHDNTGVDHWLVKFNQLLTKNGLTQVTQLEIDNV